MKLRSVGLIAFCTLAISTATAQADFTAARLISGTTALPFEEAASPAFAQNGRYVVFRGSVAATPGIYRRDLLVGGVELVAGRDDSQPALSAPDAVAPSVSADGRYIAFTTTADLDPQDDTGSGCPQVYVRDMDLPAGAPGAYTLVSALNGTSRGLTYEDPSVSCPPTTPPQLVIGGSQAAPGVALSADGRSVAFTILTASNLTTGEGGQTTTPAGQVVLRNLDSKTTTLVSATPDGQPTPEGGTFPSAESRQQLSPGYVYINSEEPSASSAALSADGSTVAWQGTNVPAQVPSATDVTAGMATLGGAGREVEPLWRRIAGASAGVTKRLLSGAGLNLFFGEALEETEPVSGGAIAPLHENFLAPALSVDGSSVAVLASAPTPVNEASYRYLSYKAPLPTEAYLVTVGEAPSAPPHLTALTATASFVAHDALLNEVVNPAISASGSRVAFNTRATNFDLAPPTLISPPAPEGIHNYTYEVNTALKTLQRVTTTYDGQPPTGNAGALSFSGAGYSLAFASSASNLFFGDGTPLASQVYTVEEIQTAGEVATQNVGSAPLTTLPSPSWILDATASAQPNGTVLVHAQLPGASRIAVRLTSQLPVATGSSPSAKHSRAKRSSRSQKAKAASRKPKQAIAGRRKVQARPTSGPASLLAQASDSARGPSALTLRLRPSARYRKLLGTRQGLYCLVNITLTAPGHPSLIQKIPLTVRIVRKPVKPASKTGKPRSSGTPK
jgi:hypothetical protein